MGKHDWKFMMSLGLVACIALSIFSVMVYKTAEVQKEERAIIERESTERTEERSQFWQKLIPWGDDESEDGRGTPAPEPAE